MTRAAYYHDMKAIARATRTQYGLTSPRVQKSHLRAIYRDKGIRIDLWPHKLRSIRGAYFNDEFGVTVMLAKGLPEDPMVFTMAHELKHHLVDRDLPVACCSDRNDNELIEIGAEVFAAELIFPEQDFLDALAAGD
jgi:Zn-dependent peptidase ImmA (M78 family)